MNIYIAHSSSFDFRNELYVPLRSSSLNAEHKIVLPHEDSDAQFDSKSYFKSECDYVIAEVSYPSTGMGIELGWANVLNIPIIAVHKEGTKVSGAIFAVTNDVFGYSNFAHMINIVKKFINKK